MTRICGPQGQNRQQGADRRAGRPSYLDRVKKRIVQDRTKLKGRTEAAERYARGAAVVASAAVGEAEETALEAWLARKDANNAQGTKAA